MPSRNPWVFEINKNCVWTIIAKNRISQIFVYSFERRKSFQLSILWELWPAAAGQLLLSCTSPWYHMAHSMDSINGVSCCSSLTPIQRILSSCPSLTPFVEKWTLRWNLIRGSEIALGLGARLARPFGCLLKVFHSIILGRIKTQLTRECWLLLVSGSGYVSVSGSRSASVCVSLSWQWGLRPGAVTVRKWWGGEHCQLGWP